MKAISGLPKEFNKLVARKLSVKFREATEVVSAPMPTTLKPTEVLIRNAYAGINASDINYTAGAYRPGVVPPFDTGFEAIGEVVAVGSEVTQFQLGDAVSSQCYGAFAEYQVVPCRSARSIPAAEADMLPIEISGMTAAVCLGEVVKPKKGETALVTAGAGGTGQFAVQLLKLAGCHVIATCRNEDKVNYLKSLGVDRVIDYKNELVTNVLANEYPTGVNIIFESVGGPLFDACLQNIAQKGRLISIGSISGYKDGSSFRATVPSVSIPTVLLRRSATLQGFFLPHYTKHIPKYFSEMLELHKEGKIVSGVDKTATFEGLEKVADAVEHLHSGKNIGKVIVKL